CIFDPLFFPPRFRLSSLFSNDPATTAIYTLSLHDALPISICTFAITMVNSWFPPSKVMTSMVTRIGVSLSGLTSPTEPIFEWMRSEEHTSELQSRFDLVCRLLLEKKKRQNRTRNQNARPAP